jgi:hypothetical protein
MNKLVNFNVKEYKKNLKKKEEWLWRLL